MGLELRLHALLRLLEVGSQIYVVRLIAHFDRLCRKTFHQHFNVKQVDTYQPVQLTASALLLRNVLATPEDFFGHVRQSVGHIQIYILLTALLAVTQALSS